MFDSSPLLDGLIAHVADVFAPLCAELATLRDDEIVDRLREVETVGRWMDAARLLLAGEVAQRSRPSLGSDGLAASRGCRTPSELIERATLVSGATARARIRTAVSLRGEIALTGDELPAPFPRVVKALREGLLGADAASAIISALAPIVKNGGQLDDVSAAEAELVAAAIGADSGAAESDGAEMGGAGSASPVGVDARRPQPGLAAPADDIRIMAQTWALYLDPDGILPDEHAAQRRRGITFGRARQGTVPVRGDLLPEVAAQWKRLEDSFLNPRVDAGPRFEESTGEPDAPLDPRTSAQKRHDALAGILTVAAGSGAAPQSGGAAPVLVVTITEAALGAGDGIAFVQGADDPAVPVAVAHQVGCAGAVQHARLDAFGRVIALGTPQRIFTAHQRRAIALRDGECVIPGCHVPASWCEVHHVQEAARGGPTHTDNGVLLCWHHHRTIETNGWEIRMVDGVPWIRAPRWLDLSRRWRPASGSQHRQLEALRSRST